VAIVRDFPAKLPGRVCQRFSASAAPLQRPMRLSDRHRYSVAGRPEGEKWQSVAFYCAVASTAVEKRRRAIMWIIRPAGRFVCPLERSIGVSQKLVVVGSPVLTTCTCTKKVPMRQAAGCLHVLCAATGLKP
jgi:hypothetical protein